MKLNFQWAELIGTWREYKSWWQPALCAWETPERCQHWKKFVSAVTSSKSRIIGWCIYTYFILVGHWHTCWWILRLSLTALNFDITNYQYSEINLRFFLSISAGNGDILVTNITKVFWCWMRLGYSKVWLVTPSYD